MHRIIIGRPEGQRLMLNNARYCLRMIQLRILSRLDGGLLTPELGHPLAVLCMHLAILLLALGMCSKTNHLLTEYLDTLRSFHLLVGSASIGLEELYFILSKEFELLLLLVLGVGLMYSQYLLLLGLGQGD